MGVLSTVHEGEFTPGKYGEWRFDKRSYSNIPPPRHLTNPPPGITNELASILSLPAPDITRQLLSADCHFNGRIHLALALPLSAWLTDLPPL